METAYDDLTIREDLSVPDVMVFTALLPWSVVPNKGPSDRFYPSDPAFRYIPGKMATGWKFQLKRGAGTPHTTMPKEFFVPMSSVISWSTTND